MFMLLLILAGCSTNGSTESEDPSNNVTMTEENSSHFSNSSNTSSVTNETKLDFSYAVNTSDFTKEVTIDENGNKEKIYNKDFERNKQIIVINMKDLNEFGKGIYISPMDGLTGDEMSFYPISMIDQETKKIKVKSKDNETRDVKVNTEFTIETFPGNEDSLNLVGKSGYLFYNKNGTISIAFPDATKGVFTEYVERNNHSADNVQQDSGKANNTENDTKRKEYYNLIYKAWDKQRKYI